MSSAPLARPVDEKETNPAIKVWKDIKWKIQPEAYNVRKLMLKALEKAVDSSESLATNEHNKLESKEWFKDLFDEETYEKLFTQEHFGNFVIIRTTGIKDFEEMPIYARVGMHLLFYGSAQIRFVRWNLVRDALKAQSIRQGKVYDQEGPEVVKRIQDFIKTYEINMEEVLIQNLGEYKTFNQFFGRKLKPEARKLAAPNDDSVITSAADCRLNVFPSLDIARQFWVKGRKFTLPELLGSAALAQRFGKVPSLAIFRLAPQDYHRWHSPVTGTIESITTLPGDYYTVNPQAINEPLDVLTANRRDVCIVNAVLSNTASTSNASVKKVPVAVVAIGALLVGSVNWSPKVGEEVKKGDDMGWFQYGGSTVVVVFPEEAHVTWDEDLRKASTGEWQGTEDPAVMAKIPANAKIGPIHKTGVFGIEVVVSAKENIGVSAPATEVPTASTSAGA